MCRHLYNVHLSPLTSSLRNRITKTQTYLARSKICTNFRPISFAHLNPSHVRIISVMSSLSGFDITTGRNSCFKLSGSFCRPPYPLPAGFNVTNIPASASRETSWFRSFIVFEWFFRPEIDINIISSKKISSALFRPR